MEISCPIANCVVSLANLELHVASEHDTTIVPLVNGWVSKKFYEPEATIEDKKESYWRLLLTWEKV